MSKKHWLLKLNPKSFSRRLIPLFALVAVILWSAVAVSPGKTLDVYFLNVGQGDAVYGRLPTGEDFLIDGGPDNKVLSELSAVMPPWDKTIDLVIASHNHADHIKGLVGVLAQYDVKEIWLSGAVHTTQTYLDFLAKVKKEKEGGAVVWTAKAGDKKELGAAQITVLYPVKLQEGLRPDDQHDATIVAKLSYSKISYLLTGDLNEDHERNILAQNAQNVQVVQSEVLKVPHHGSATGLLEEFLDAVKPKYVVISVGKGNKFGHPAASAIKKLADRSIPHYRTDENGRVQVSTDGEHIFVKTQR